jgi:hypothetical protein
MKDTSTKSDIERNYKYFSGAKGEYLVALETIKAIMPIQTWKGEEVLGYTTEEIDTGRMIPECMVDIEPGDVWQVTYQNNTVWSGAVSAKKIGQKTSGATKRFIAKFNKDLAFVA